ncbi:MAG: glycosyltransferase family 4 protein [Anaerolineae bacterium]|nr:glycosyltransferase family 4 protein [Anaerolineae bacterium]
MARVAIEYSPALLQVGGVGRSVREMTAALLHSAKHAYTLMTSGLPAPHFPPNLHAPRRNIPLPDRLLTRLWHRAGVAFPAALFTRGFDLFFATNFALPPLPRGMRTAVFVHDLTYLHAAEAAVPSLIAYLSSVVPRAVTTADVVVVNSLSTKRDLVSAYDVDPQRIHAVQFGVGAQFGPVEAELARRTAARYGLGGSPFVFAVGTLQPRKNYSRLIEAVAILRHSGQDVQLAIAGPEGWMMDDLRRDAESASSQFVRLLGKVPDSDLPALYNAALCFAMPSLYEGYGLPVLEAMACGAPVVTSNVSSLPEAAGGAALLVDPRDVSALADALGQLMTNPELRAGLSARGLERVHGLTWARTAVDLEAAFDFALANPRA